MNNLSKVVGQGFYCRSIAEARQSKIVLKLKETEPNFDLNDLSSNLTRIKVREPSERDLLSLSEDLTPEKQDSSQYPTQQKDEDRDAEAINSDVLLLTPHDYIKMQTELEYKDQKDHHSEYVGREIISSTFVNKLNLDSTGIRTVPITKSAYSIIEKKGGANSKTHLAFEDNDKRIILQRVEEPQRGDGERVVHNKGPTGVHNQRKSGSGHPSKAGSLRNIEQYKQEKDRDLLKDQSDIELLKQVSREVHESNLSDSSRSHPQNKMNRPTLSKEGQDPKRISKHFVTETENSNSLRVNIMKQHSKKSSNPYIPVNKPIAHSVHIPQSFSPSNIDSEQTPDLNLLQQDDRAAFQVEPIKSGMHYKYNGKTYEESGDSEFILKSGLLGKFHLRRTGFEGSPKFHLAVLEKLNQLKSILNANLPAYMLDKLTVMDVDDMLEILNSHLSKEAANMKAAKENILKAEKENTILQQKVIQMESVFQEKIRKLEKCVNSSIERQRELSSQSKRLRTNSRNEESAGRSIVFERVNATTSSQFQLKKDSVMAASNTSHSNIHSGFLANMQRIKSSIYKPSDHFYQNVVSEEKGAEWSTKSNGRMQKGNKSTVSKQTSNYEAGYSDSVNVTEQKTETAEELSTHFIYNTENPEESKLRNHSRGSNNPSTQTGQKGRFNAYIRLKNQTQPEDDISSQEMMNLEQNSRIAGISQQKANLKESLIKLHRPATKLLTVKGEPKEKINPLIRKAAPNHSQKETGDKKELFIRRTDELKSSKSVRKGEVPGNTSNFAEDLMHIIKNHRK